MDPSLYVLRYGTGDSASSPVPQMRRQIVMYIGLLSIGQNMVVMMSIIRRRSQQHDRGEITCYYIYLIYNNITFPGQCR